jgi:hypothetical protein
VKGLQFDAVDRLSGAAANCTSCGKPITTEYYEVNGQVACEDCRIAAEERFNLGGGATRFVRATALGLLAGAAGFGIYYGIARLTGREFGLIAALIGLMVGGAVKRGSGGRGGWKYQLLAVLLTYTAIVSSYVPFIVEEVLKEGKVQAAADSVAPAARDSLARLIAVTGDSTLTTAAAATARGVGPGDGEHGGMATMVLGLLAVTAFIFAVPFLAGVENLLGLLIIGIGLYEAWHLNRRGILNISGPFRLAAGSG